MSKKHFNPLEDPPTASSSDDDDQMETTSLAGNSSSEEETDDESSKTPSLKKPAESSAQQAKPLTKSSTKKRSLSETDGAAAAKKKVKSGGSGGEETKKTYFQRVWSEEDEINALQGLIDYKNDTGASPYDDTNAFYGFVKKSISFDVSKTQFMKKLRGLKKKCENNLGKEKELAFSKPHDRKAFDLSKFVWGADGVGLDSAVKSKKKKKKSSKKVEDVKQELASSPSLPNGEDEEIGKKGEAPSVVEVDAFDKSVLVTALTRFGVDDLSAQKGWSRLALQLRELEFYSNKSGFVHEVVTKMAEAFRPNP
ncbi:unnamed protein product [Eruca vesicaria subsp. sativa]|uniref:Glabrous enhancer-binding protein-like DBD domain-containing protein n=1 Tax=Eruca vesicaria subsp. sativa TaxID=29727 RepID=A0ABC8L7J3_ERUVS|nr:unnamed protein product [Eruca vesicaria subsp. sativa]